MSNQVRILPTQRNIVKVIGRNSLKVLNPAIPLSVLTIGQQGPMGPAGASGAGAALSGIAAVNISAGTVVIVFDDGQVHVADPTNLTQGGYGLGIATTSATEGNSINYILSGIVTGLSGLTTGGRYWVGLNGTISATEVAEGARWERFLGVALSASSLLLVQFPALGL